MVSLLLGPSSASESILIITPILVSPPVNQLLATGGSLLIQSFATFLWTTDHKTVRLSLPSYEVAGIFLPAGRIIPFAISIVAMVALYLFLTRTYMGTAIRAVSQDRDAMRLMGANPQRVYIVTSAVGGLMAGLAGALLIFQYSVHPFFGGQFGPLTFMICVLGGLGTWWGRFRRVLHHERDHLGLRCALVHRDGLRDRLRGVHRNDLRPPRRHHGEAAVSRGRIVGGLFLAVLLAGPFLPLGVTREYIIHVAVQVLIWSFIGGAWSLMGRFGLVSLGHGPS